jgi:hypothetical protein
MRGKFSPASRVVSGKPLPHRRRAQGQPDAIDQPALDLLARDVDIDDPPDIGHRHDAVDHHTLPGLPRGDHGGDASATDTMARDALPAGIMAPVPVRQGRDTLQTRRQTRIALQHGHAIGQGSRRRAVAISSMKLSVMKAASPCPFPRSRPVGRPTDTGACSMDSAGMA